MGKSITDLDLSKIDPQELREVEAVLSTFPPTSVIASVVRDVTYGARWATDRGGRDLIVTVERREPTDRERNLTAWAAAE